MIRPLFRWSDFREIPSWWQQYKRDWNLMLARRHTTTQNVAVGLTILVTVWLLILCGFIGLVAWVWDLLLAP